MAITNRAKRIQRAKREANMVNFAINVGGKALLLLIIVVGGIWLFFVGLPIWYLFQIPISLYKRFRIDKESSAFYQFKQKDYYARKIWTSFLGILIWLGACWVAFDSPLVSYINLFTQQYLSSSNMTADDFNMRSGIVSMAVVVLITLILVKLVKMYHQWRNDNLSMPEE